MKQLQARKSLSQQVAEAVSEEISCGRFALGQMLSESRIAQQLGVSRTPVREAFSHLEFRGLLVTRPQSGTYVFEANETAVRELFEVSACLEMQGLRSAIERNPDGIVRDVSSVCEEMSSVFASEAKERYTALDRAFHTAFVDSSDNALLNELYAPVSLKLQALAHAGVHREPIDANYHEQHLEIAAELAKKGIEAVQSLFSRHLQAASQLRPT